ncbi:MAG: SUMF1/EgtB/PvdO family nonheme iron enzyme [Polyangiaceae bacterium]
MVPADVSPRRKRSASFLVAFAVVSAATVPGAEAARTPRLDGTVLFLPVRGRVRLPGGIFVMGSTANDMVRAVLACRKEVLRSRCDDASNRFRAEGLAHEVVLSPFALDITEVTVAAYGECVAEGACAPPGFVPGDARFDRPDFPVTHVRWDDAVDYCRFRGGRLPTEAEWEFAARGPNGREYPWGTNWNPHLANHGAFSHDETDATDGYLGLAPVGSFPDGRTPLGIHDLAGNVSEWVHDVYDVNENGFGYGEVAVKNPRGATSGGFHVIRGGSYEEGAPWLRGASRGFSTLMRTSTIGFRCAADAHFPEGD